MRHADRHKWDAFISYTRKLPDAWLARQAYDTLTRAGLKVWLDRTKIGIGDDFHEEIVSNLELSQTVICIITPRSLDSRWCNSEWFYGLATAHVLPVVQGVKFEDLPFGINAKQALEVPSLWTPEQLVLLKAKLQQLALKSVSSRKPPSAPNTIAEFFEQAVEWPPFPASRATWINRIRQAEHALLQLPQTERWVRSYNDPRECLTALREIKAALNAKGGNPETWRAFADLAAPFSRAYRTIGLKNAKTNSVEFAAELGATPAEMEAAYFASLEAIGQQDKEYEEKCLPAVNQAVEILQKHQNQNLAENASIASIGPRASKMRASAGAAARNTPLAAESSEAQKWRRLYITIIACTLLWLAGYEMLFRGSDRGRQDQTFPEATSLPSARKTSDGP